MNPDRLACSDAEQSGPPDSRCTGTWFACADQFRSNVNVVLYRIRPSFVALRGRLTYIRMVDPSTKPAFRGRPQLVSKRCSRQAARAGDVNLQPLARAPCG